MQKAVISPCRTPVISGGLRTKSWPGFSEVIGNCRCKRAINASNAITEKYIPHSDDACCTRQAARWDQSLRCGNPCYVSEPENLFPESLARVQWGYLRGRKAQRKAKLLILSINAELMQKYICIFGGHSEFEVKMQQFIKWLIPNMV